MTSGRVGIVSFAAYVPWTRVGRGEKDDAGPLRAMCGADEDSVTMAVAAGAVCLAGHGRSAIDAVLFASTTAPYGEKQTAALIARALDLGRDLRTVDLAGSLRAGVSALAAAGDAVAAGSARRVLVLAADDRRAAPGSALDGKLGAAAAAFLIGAEDAIAVFADRIAVADEILDVWRPAGERVVDSWEERFTCKHGYHDNLYAAVRRLGERAAGRVPDRYVLAGPDARAHAGLASALGLTRAQVQDPLFDQVGNAGAAFAPLLLCAALEQSRPGERILCAAHGDGAEAFLVDTTAALAPRVPRRGLAWHLARKRVVAAPAVSAVAARTAGPGPSATRAYRERDAELGLVAFACRRCETLHFPAQRVCLRCQKRDDFAPVRLSDRAGRVLSYTFDYFHPAAERPTIAGIVEVSGGCRLYLQMTDASPAELRLDLPVELCFRRIHDGGGRPNYYWKSTPVRDDAGKVAS
jgi:3-hydroxy-3-methylglutaryl CoA synthase/uncharacterized OB-fold protein